MNYLSAFFNGLWKFAVLAILFFAGFGLLAFLLTGFLEGQSLIVWGLFLLPYGWLLNRFVLSPAEYYLDYKTLHYDPWYENRMTRKGRSRSSRKSP